MSAPKLFTFSLACFLALSGCGAVRMAALHKDPLSPEEHVKLASAYNAQGKAELSKREYEAALRRERKSVPALAGLGNLAFEREEWKRAEKYYKRALRASTGNPGVSNNLAMCYVKRGERLDEAEELVRKGLENPGVLEPYLLDTLEQIRQARLKISQSAEQKKETP